MPSKDTELNGFFSPGDLAFLESVVFEVCPDNDRDNDGERMALVAAAAFEMYQSGVSEHQVMVERLRAL